ncbi:MAG: hypothetical protein ABR612_14010 [Chromatocurvus sp.]
MSEVSDSGSIIRSAGESIGGFLAGIPPALVNFVSGVGEGAGLHGLLDWTAMIVGIALLLSTIRGLMNGRIVGPVLRGAVGVVFMGWAIA